jgi:hypothetical protein
MEEVVNSIKETTGSQEFIEDITIGCKHQSSQPPFTRPEGAREAGLDSLQYARELGSTPNYTNPYKLDKPSDLVVRYDPKEAITSGLEAHLNQTKSDNESSSFGVTAEDGSSRSISSSSKTRKPKGSGMTKPSEPVMPRPVPESSVGQVVNAVLLTVPDGVPVETADLSDLPPQYRAILKEDNTVTEPTPGQTSNI